MSTTSTFVNMQSDGTLVRIKPDGTEETIAVPPVAPRSDEAVTAAAMRDPDAQPLTDADLARMKRVSHVKTLRRALGLTQEECAARYHIPLGTLRDWEQGRCEPDYLPAPISPSLRTPPKASNACYKQGHTKRTLDSWGQFVQC